MGSAPETASSPNETFVPAPIVGACVIPATLYPETTKDPLGVADNCKLSPAQIELGVAEVVKENVVTVI